MRFADNMNKISKLNMLYDLVDVQGIRVMVNIGISSSAPTPLATTTPSPTPYPTPIVEAFASIHEVDHLLDIATSFMVEEPTSPPVSTKKASDEEQ